MCHTLVLIIPFLSTLSLRRATGYGDCPPSRSAISIHALLAESDFITRPATPRTSYFYPRSPCGERHIRRGMYMCTAPEFLSTLSLRRATAHLPGRFTRSAFLSTLSLRRATTQCRQPQPRRLFISIHALLAESDFSDLVIASDIIHFYPRSPCGERLTVPDLGKGDIWISIHALLAESD